MQSSTDQTLTSSFARPVGITALVFLYAAVALLCFASTIWLILSLWFEHSWMSISIQQLTPPIYAFIVGNVLLRYFAYGLWYMRSGPYIVSLFLFGLLMAVCFIIGLTGVTWGFILLIGVSVIFGYLIRGSIWWQFHPQSRKE